MQWPKVTASNSWGYRGTLSSAGGPRQRPGGGPGGQAPVSSEHPVV